MLVDDVETRLKELLPTIANESGCCIESMKVMPDHIHIFIKGNPTIPIHLIIKNLKGKVAGYSGMSSHNSEEGYLAFGQEVTIAKQ